MTWELNATNEAFLYPVPFEEGKDTWYTLRPGADCNTLEFTYIWENGSTLGPAPLHRGEVCARSPDPEACPSCIETYWCDEPPPPCDDAE